MISSEQISDYVNSLLKLDKRETDKLHSFLKNNQYPVIKKDVSRFLTQTVMIKQPEKILEIGTNEGYSATVMALAMKEGTITTVDYRKDLHEKARINFEKFGVLQKIELITGYSQDVLPVLDESFDLIFVDADKKRYFQYLDYAVTHLNKGGVLIVDNLFWKGSVIAPGEFENEKSAAPTLAEFNKRFTKLDGFVSQVLSVGDGLGFAVKEENFYE